MDELAASQPHTIRRMFGSIAGKYDLVNSVLSFGIHHFWKNQLIKASAAKPGHCILDCATGTGDLAFKFESLLQKKGKVIGTDFCEPMLKRARMKATEQSSLAEFQWADVMELPFSDQTFDIASISFGIRNVEDPKKALSELGRVVKPGGKVLVLEFGQPQSSWLAPLYRFYSEKILPQIGGWISGQPQAYEYLNSSAATFPSGRDFLALAKSTGSFKGVKQRSFFTGIAYLYVLET